MLQGLCPVGGTGRLPQGPYGGTRCLCFADSSPFHLLLGVQALGLLCTLCGCHSEMMRCCGNAECS